MEKEKFKLLFYLKRGTQDKNGKSPIMGRILSLIHILPLVGNVFSVYDLSDDNFALSSDCLLYTSATFSESAPNAATIISKVFFSIDTISIFMQLSVCPQR